MKIKLLLTCLVLSLSLITIVKSESLESQDSKNLNEKWIKNDKYAIEMTVDGKNTGFKIKRNFGSTANFGEPFQLIDPDNRTIECENGIGYCKEQARVRYQDLQEFERTTKK